jgi:hypothetical protein
MSVNHHGAAAGSILTNDKAWTVGWETADAQHIAAHIEAQAEATLAVAYEQRTANLIAWAAGGQPTPELREMIAQRLDLA